MTEVPQVVLEFAAELLALGWVTDLLVGGSLASGDYTPVTSDLDLVAVVDGPVERPRRTTLRSVHERIDEGAGSGLRLGCAYVSSAQIVDPTRRHPTWTHGSLVDRVLSGISRAELVRYGRPVFGRAPGQVLPAMTDDDVRAAARAELTGYWARAVRHPTWWWDPVLADLGLTSMARGRHSLATGELLTKTEAIERADVPPWLREQLRARRRGQTVTSPRLRTACLAWRDARRTVALARSIG